MNGYEIKVECRQRDVAVVKQLLDLSQVIEEEFANLYVPETQHAIALVVKPMDGSSHGFITVGQVAVGGWEFGAGGQSERNTMSITFNAQDVKYIEA